MLSTSESHLGAMVQFHEAGLFWQTKLNLQATKAMDLHQQRSIQKGFHLVKIGVVHVKSWQNPNDCDHFKLLPLDHGEFL